MNRIKEIRARVDDIAKRNPGDPLNIPDITVSLQLVANELEALVQAVDTHDSRISELYDWS